jgi:hypothetical protein
LVVPGIETIQGFCASSQASATCARALALRDPAEQVDQGEVRLARLFREARHDVAEVVLPNEVFSSVAPVRKR